jgi:hypothetical protein
MRKLTASDRSALIRLASSLPVGSSERKAILAGLQPRKLDWKPVEGAALDKFLSVFAAQFSADEKPVIIAAKAGRKTVFARDSGVFRLYVAGDDGQIYSMKTYGLPNLAGIQPLLTAAAIGLTPELRKEGVYQNGPLGRP